MNNDKTSLSDEFLRDCLQKTGESLNKLSQANDIELRLVTPDNNNVLHAYNKQWNGANFSWDKILLSGSEEKKSSFSAGLFKGGNLSGLCCMKPGRIMGVRSLLIEYIEASPNKATNPLKGAVLSAFTQACKDIAGLEDLPYVGVHSPVPNAMDVYRSAGFNLHDSTNSYMVVKVS